MGALLGLALLTFGEQDGHSGFVNETLDVLLGFAKQVAFDDDRAVVDGLGAAFPDKNAADRLLAGIRLGLRAGPAVETVPRLHLDAEKKRLLADIQPRVRIGLDPKAADDARIIDQQCENGRVTGYDGAIPAGDGIIAELDRMKSGRIGGTVAPAGPAGQRFLRIGCAGKVDI